MLSCLCSSSSWVFKSIQVGPRAAALRQPDPFQTLSQRLWLFSPSSNAAEICSQSHEPRSRLSETRISASFFLSSVFVVSRHGLFPLFFFVRRRVFLYCPCCWLRVDQSVNRDTKTFRSSLCELYIYFYLTLIFFIFGDILSLAQSRSSDVLLFSVQIAIACDECKKAARAVF